MPSPASSEWIRPAPITYAAPTLGVGGEVANAVLNADLRVSMAPPGALNGRAGGVEMILTTTAASGPRSFNVYRATAARGSDVRHLDLLGVLSGTISATAGSGTSPILPAGWRTIDSLAFAESTEASSPAGRGSTIRLAYGGRDPRVSNGTGLRSIFFLPDGGNADEIILEPQSGDAGEQFAVVYRAGH